MPNFVLNAQDLQAGPAPAQDVLSVTAAIIRKNGRVLLCQRPRGKSCALLWEFPGGKTEPGESEEDCVRRECREELGVELRVIAKYWEVVTRDGGRAVRLTFFVCELEEGEPRRREHAALAWAFPQNLGGYAFCPGDDRMLRERGLKDALSLQGET